MQEKNIQENENALIKSSPFIQFHWKADKGWPVKSVSPNIDILGYTPDEFTSVNKKYSDIIVPEDLPFVEEIVNKEIEKQKEHFDVEYRIFDKKGKKLWVHEWSIVIYNHSGKPLDFNGIIEIIESRKQNELRLKESEERYRVLFETGLDALFMIENENGKIISANRAAEKMYGYTRGEFYNLTLNNLKERVTQSPLTSKEDRPSFCRHRDKSGNSFPVEINTRSFSWRNKEVSLLEVRNITDRLETERNREQRNKELGLISKTTLRISRSPDTDEICETIADAVHSIFPGDYIIVSLFEPDAGGIIIKTHRGFGKLTGMVTDSLGKDPQKMVFPPENMKEKECLDFCSGKMTEVKKGTYALLQRKVPEMLCRVMESTLGIKKSFTTGFSLEGVPQGGVTILGKNDGYMEYRSAIETIINHAAVEINRRRTEQKLFESEQRYRQLAETLPLGVEEIDLSGMITLVNPAYTDLTGYSLKEAVGKAIWDFCPESAPLRNLFFEIIYKKPPPSPWFGDNVHKNGSLIKLRVDWNYRVDSYGELTGLVAVLTDISEKRKLEEQLHQKQKLEAIGQLAGGIAHDFNNQLAGILGYADLLSGKLGENKKLVRYCSHIISSAERAGHLTNQLLAFARKGKYLTVGTDIHKLLDETVSILKRSIDKNIIIVKEFKSDSPFTLGDPGQLQNAFLNIALNARDAMPEGGQIHIRTEDSFLDSADGKSMQHTLSSGKYLKIILTDSGKGIPKNVMDKIFEPFFTTKPQGKGTGMGLAAVYGTVKNHGGGVHIKSFPEEGTSVTIYLPAHSESASKPLRGNKEVYEKSASGTVLVVDDEHIVRDTAYEMLSTIGYKVLLAKDGESGIKVFEENRDSIDLVLLDMVMPNKGGRETFMEIQKINPNVKVLLSSGYSIDGEAQSILNLGVTGFIQKPYTTASLASRIKEALMS